MKLSDFLEVFFGLPKGLQFTVVATVVGFMIMAVYVVISHVEVNREIADLEAGEPDADYYKRHNIDMPR